MAYGELRPEFRGGLGELRAHLFGGYGGGGGGGGGAVGGSALRPKTLRGVPLNGAMFAQLVRSCVCHRDDQKTNRPTDRPTNGAMSFAQRASRRIIARAAVPRSPNHRPTQPANRRPDQTDRFQVRRRDGARRLPDDLDGVGVGHGAGVRRGALPRGRALPHRRAGGRAEPAARPRPARRVALRRAARGSAISDQEMKRWDVSYMTHLDAPRARRVSGTSSRCARCAFDREVKWRGVIT